MKAGTTAKNNREKLINDYVNNCVFDKLTRILIMYRSSISHFEDFEKFVEALLRECVPDYDEFYANLEKSSKKKNKKKEVRA